MSKKAVNVIDHAAPAILPDTAPIAAERPLPVDLDGLPELMVEIAEIAGVEAAITICDRYGGNRVYIPRYAPDHHWLVHCVGRVAADALCEHFASPSGIELELPTGARLNRTQRRARLEKLIADGYTSSEITRRLGVTRRCVSRAKADMTRRVGANQLDMFLPPPDATGDGSR
ncbi:MAG: hypothetical protein ABL893_11275 [Hyphomicrobium sp.]